MLAFLAAWLASVIEAALDIFGWYRSSVSFGVVAFGVVTLAALIQWVVLAYRDWQWKKQWK